ncbi:MAG: cohesin domain-containing protein, partial [Defluviitaleaceae bacterium]|nr:cohesin domain-containing protein [Defluviitaleaceae bacterium]
MLRKIKRAAASLLAAIMAVGIVSFAPLPVSAEENAPTIIVSDAVGNVGETVEITISLADNPGVVTMRLFVSFDDTILQLTGVSDKGNLGAQYHPAIDNYQWPYTLYWENATLTENIMYSGEIAELSFEIISEGYSEISVSYDYDLYDILDKDFNKIFFETKSGSVTQPDCDCGECGCQDCFPPYGECGVCEICDPPVSHVTVAAFDSSWSAGPSSGSGNNVRGILNLSFTVTDSEGEKITLTEQVTGIAEGNNQTRAFVYAVGCDTLNVSVRFNATRSGSDLTYNNVVISYTSSTPWANVYTVAPTCLEDGYTVSKCGCGHSVIAVNAGSALGHDGSGADATCYEAKICARNNCGTELAPALGHTRGVAICTDIQECIRCDYLFEAELEHEWDEGTVTQPPTCVTEGVLTFSCLRDGCSATETEDIDVVVCIIDTTPLKAATCVEDGTGGIYCP